MDFVQLDQRHHDQLLILEKDMYWTEGEWKKKWENGARQKFDDLITDYLTNFPQGCFGLVEKGELIGAIFLLKVSELKPIPYVNKVADHFSETGDIAYVSFFVIKKGDGDEEIAQELYDKAQDVALLSISCKKIAVVINNSPLEEKILIGNDYERSVEEFQWEIYPGIMVPCHIYSYSLLMEESK